MEAKHCGARLACLNDKAVLADLLVLVHPPVSDPQLRKPPSSTRHSVEVKDRETFAVGGSQQMAVSTDEVMSPRALVTPDEGGCQLQRVGGPQGMQMQDSFGFLLEFNQRLDFMPALSEILDRRF